MVYPHMTRKESQTERALPFRRWLAGDTRVDETTTESDTGDSPQTLLGFRRAEAAREVADPQGPPARRRQHVPCASYGFAKT